MSADNWTCCPKCMKKAYESLQAFEKKVRDSYGNVSVEEYDNLTAQLEQMKKSSTRSATLREDYDIGIRNGEFHVLFRASCNTCKYSFKFEETRQLHI